MDYQEDQQQQQFDGNNNFDQQNAEDNTNNNVSNEPRESGVCKWFNTTKGFGFITPNAGGEDVFVHQTAIYARGFRSLAEGEQVEYNVVIEGGRSKATNVTGPNGDYVQGAPQQNRGGGGGGFGGGRFDGGFRRGGPRGGQSGGHYNRDYSQQQGYGFVQQNGGGFNAPYGGHGGGYHQGYAQQQGSAFGGGYNGAPYGQQHGGYDQQQQQGFDQGYNNNY